MAKPDLEKMFVTPSGQAMRDDGMGSLMLAFKNLPRYSNSTTAAAGGVPVGGLYVITTTSGLAMRLV